MPVFEHEPLGRKRGSVNSPDDRLGRHGPCLELVAVAVLPPARSNAAKSVVRPRLDAIARVRSLHKHTNTETWCQTNQHTQKQRLAARAWQNRLNGVRGLTARRSAACSACGADDVTKTLARAHTRTLLCRRYDTGALAGVYHPPFGEGKIMVTLHTM